MSAAVDMALSPDSVRAQLDAASAEGAPSYFASWKRIAAGLSVKPLIEWDEVWPRFAIAVDMEGESVERARCIGLLGEHLKASGYRRALFADYLAAEPCQTREGAGPEAVACATMRVVRDFLKADGRILIAPDGRLTEGGGLPSSWGSEGDEHDAEIARASRAHMVATLCDRPRDFIHHLAGKFGERLDNGWIELTRLSPFFSQAEAAFAEWKSALLAIHAAPDDEESPTEWAIVDAAEATVLESHEGGDRVAAIRLWIALHHTSALRGPVDAALTEDLPALLADDLDWSDKLIVLALKALTAKRGVGDE